VLTEARVVLPGAQALLGIQLGVTLTDGFSRLSPYLKYLHLACLGLMVLTIVFLMAPAAFHRIVEDGEDSERLHRFASAMVLAAMVPLALGITGDFYIVAVKVLESDQLALVLSILLLLTFFGLWFGLTNLLRTRRANSRPASVAGQPS
jgi:putative copper export protein